MPAKDLKIKDGFAVFKDSNTDMFAVTPQHSLIDTLLLCETEDEAMESTDKVLSSFYSVAETFLQHLSEGIEHVQDIDMIRMSELIDTITKMKYSSDNMPRYYSNVCDNLTIITKAFDTNETVFVIDRETGDTKEGHIVDVIYRSADVETYDANEILDSKKSYNISCEFVTDDDCITIFIELD